MRHEETRKTIPFNSGAKMGERSLKEGLEKLDSNKIVMWGS